jgi:hypothetical protein
MPVQSTGFKKMPVHRVPGSKRSRRKERSSHFVS